MPTLATYATRPEATRYLDAVRSGASTPKAIRTQAAITERVRINVQRALQDLGLVTWAEETGWTAPTEPQAAHKVCPQCNTSGSIDVLFGWRMAAGKQRAQSYCKPCRRANSRARRTP